MNLYHPLEGNACPPWLGSDACPCPCGRVPILQFKRGTPLCGPVVVGGETVDPFNLYKAVTNKGGAHVVGSFPC